jgi:signal transduction histidine kinase
VLASGLHPSVLSERGLAAALHALALAAPVTVNLHSLPDGRLPEPVEASVYYVVAEAVANAQKHAAASTIGVRVDRPDGVVRVEVVDDGVGGADHEGGGCAASQTGSSRSGAASRCGAPPERART